MMGAQFDGAGDTQRPSRWRPIKMGLGLYTQLSRWHLRVGEGGKWTEWDNSPANDSPAAPALTLSHLACCAAIFRYLSRVLPWQRQAPADDPQQEPAGQHEVGDSPASPAAAQPASPGFESWHVPLEDGAQAKDLAGQASSDSLENGLKAIDLGEIIAQAGKRKDRNPIMYMELDESV
ncbi:unnamed protein product [Ostreobium quekettii]|uniref:Uncharacterized protein n=1 Tax=Ostreobium quekettii TaxID=121088 RepID=A0A8S1IXF0_9CHLO|nr:unnamed protein product [Ostreobium quekettii]|eukprot:evm.model.scf_662.1 EVM.evm.TU.scf_662.1   scf_662:5779-6312(-)